MVTWYPVGHIDTGIRPETGKLSDKTNCYFYILAAAVWGFGAHARQCKEPGHGSAVAALLYVLSCRCCLRFWCACAAMPRAWPWICCNCPTLCTFLQVLSEGLVRMRGNAKSLARELLELPYFANKSSGALAQDIQDLVKKRWACCKNFWLHLRYNKILYPYW